ncbi:MAG: TGS domain-containing protein, partial [Simkaniaceae bacterium]|nr:TGS domain-containing protein [Simkaniaceae bacterium]
MMVQYNQSDLELDEGSTAKDLAEKENLRDPSQALAAVINGEIKDLSTTLTANDTIELLDFDDKRGKEVFWHSSAHVLAQAILRLFPDAIPTIGPPIENGFYYDFANLHISEDDFPKIEKEIKNILKQNYKPELKRFKDKKEAIAAFKSNKFKVELIESFDEGSSLTGYQQGEFFDLC